MSQKHQQAISGTIRACSVPLGCQSDPIRNLDCLAPGAVIYSLQILQKNIKPDPAPNYGYMMLLAMNSSRHRDQEAQPDGQNGALSFANGYPRRTLYAS